MNELTEKRRSKLISFGYFAVIIALYVLFIKYAFWVVSPFIVALLVAVGLQKPINKIVERKRKKSVSLGRKNREKKILSFLFVLLIVILILAIVSFVGYKIVAEFTEFGRYCYGKLENAPELIESGADKLLEITEKLPKGVRTAVTEAIENLEDKLLSMTEDGTAYIEKKSAIAQIAQTATETGTNVADTSQVIEETTVAVSQTATEVAGTVIEATTEPVTEVATEAATEVVTEITTEETNILTTATTQVVPDNITATGTTGVESTDSSLTGLFDFSMLTTPLGGIISVAQQIPSIIVAIIISIISCFFITTDYENFTGMIKNMMTKEHEKKLADTKRIVFDVLGKWVRSYSLILFITFCELAAGLGILTACGAYSGNYIIVIAICTAILDILPVFGTGTVMIPWALISLFTHKAGLGIGLIILYVVIFLVRQVLEPKIVSDHVNMHPVVTLAGMYLGLQIFGFLGLIIVPITLVVIKKLNEENIVHIWTNRESAKE